MRAAHLPGKIAIRGSAWRRALVLWVLGALVFGLGLQSVRACPPAQPPSHRHVAVSPDRVSAPCHEEDDGVAPAACEAHCRGEAANVRYASSLDLPAAVLVDIGAGLAPMPAVMRDVGRALPPPPRRAPPLHLLFHRFLH